jgi:hypothetical protein
MILEYLTSNGLNKYPFDDSATLRNVTGLATLPNNLFLDLLVVSKIDSGNGAFIHKISNNYTGELTEELIFTLGVTLFDSSGSTVHIFEFDIPFDEVIEKEFYGMADDSVAVKVVFGTGFIEYKFKIITDPLIFSKNATTLVGSAFVPMVPRVKSIAFYNWDNVTQTAQEMPEAYFAGDEDPPPVNVTLKEGANTAFSQSKENQIIWDVLPGAGIGLYNDCDANTGIKTINGIEPDIFNRNFLMLADECYRVLPGQINDVGELIPESASLSFLNTCTPKCSSDNLKAFANYLNRIRDGTVSVSAYAANVYNNMKDEIDLYRTTVDAVKRTPKYNVRWIKNQSITGKYYFSIAASFANPTINSESLILSIVTAGNIARFKYRLDNDTTILTNATELEIEVPCEKTLYLDIVISTYIPISFTFNGSFGPTTIAFTDQLV